MFSSKRSSLGFDESSSKSAKNTKTFNPTQLNSPAANGSFGSSIFNNSSNAPNASSAQPLSFRPNAISNSSNMFNAKPTGSLFSNYQQVNTSAPLDVSKAANSNTGGGIFNNTLPMTAAQPFTVPQSSFFENTTLSQSPRNNKAIEPLRIPVHASSLSRISKDKPNAPSPRKFKSRFSLSSSRSNPYSTLQRTDAVANDIFLKSAALTKQPARFLASSSFLNDSTRSSVKKLVISKTPISSEDVRGISVTQKLLEPNQGSPINISSTPVKKAAETPQPSPRVHTPLKRVYEINKTAQDEGYWIYPPLKELFSYGFDQLSSVSDLAIGRTGHGKIQFVNPVDLSEIRNLADIMGNFVVFDATTVCVYPDDKEKVPVGTGLNVPAVITLENVFIKQQLRDRTITVNDPTSSRAVRHMAILRHNIESKGGEFITYDVTHGIFVFKVPHFSTWGFMEDDLVYDVEDTNDFDMDHEEPVAEQSDTLMRLAITSTDSQTLPEDTFENRHQQLYPAVSALTENQPISLPLVARAHHEESVGAETDMDADDLLNNTATQHDHHTTALALATHTQTEERPVVSDDWLQQLNYAADITSAFAANDVLPDPSLADLDKTVFGGFDSLKENSTTVQYALAAEKLRLVPAFKPHTYAQFSSSGLIIRDPFKPSGFTISPSKVC